MSRKFLARASALSLVVLLAACGGDDKSSPLAGTNTSAPEGGGTSGTGQDGEDTPTPIELGSLNISARPVQLGTSEKANSQIRAFVRDNNNIVVAGVPITFSVNNDAALVIDPETRDENGRALTDETGTVEARLTAGQNPKNRSVTVTAKSGKLESSIVIAVSGTSLSLEGPSSLSLGSSSSYTANLTDSEGDAITLEHIGIAGSLLPNGDTMITGESGTIIIQVTPEAVGTKELTVSAFDGESIVSATKTIEVSDNNFELNIPNAQTGLKINQTETIELNWNDNGALLAGRTINFSATRGTLNSNTATTDTNGKATVTIESSTSGTSKITATAPATGVSTAKTIEFIATQPAEIIAQISKTQLKPGEQARITAVVRDAQNNLVKNQRILFTIIEDISQGTLSVGEGVTDSLGRTTVAFTAGQSGSGRDGVVIRASLAEDSTINTLRRLTVSEGAGRITVGTGNSSQAPDEDHYRKPWVVYVTDVNGQPVENANVELSAIPVSYSTGYFERADCSGNGRLDCWVPVIDQTFLAEDGITGIAPNNKLDPGEDINNSCVLEPSNDAVVVNIEDATANNGGQHFAIEYPKSNCAWTTVRVEARAQVSGTEYKESVDVRLSCLASDLSDILITPPSISGGSKYNDLPSCP